MGRAPCCDKEAKVKKGPWTPDEDLKLVAYIQEHGHGSWRALPEKAGLARCGKSCRLRWTNYLRPDIKRGRFTREEEQTIFQLHSILGNRWSAIASRLPRRTDNEIKNYWNTHLKKRLTQVGIGPFSQTPDLLTSPWTPLVPTGLTHTTQWDLTVAEAQARLRPKPAKAQAEAATAVHPSAFFMSSWKTKVEDTLKPKFGTVTLSPSLKALQGFDSVRLDTVMEDSMPTTEDSGEGRSGVFSGSGSVLDGPAVNYRAWWPDTVLGAACIGAMEESGEGPSGMYSGSVLGDQISPRTVPDSYTTDVHSPCGSINSGTTSDCFDITLLHQSSSLQQFPVIHNQLEPSSSMPGTFWERQHVALMEALKPDSLVLGEADSETELESIIPLDFDEAEFPQFASLSEGTGQY